MDNDTRYKDTVVKCQKCKQTAIHIYTRTYDCGCAERIVICANKLCEHPIWTDFINTCEMRKDLILVTENPNVLH